MDDPQAIEVAGLVKLFGSRAALDGIDLAVPRGSIVGLIGPNGAGKTTTMRTLVDIVRPSSGRVRVLGANPREGGRALRRRIGYLPGELVLDTRSTGRRLLRHYADLSGGAAPGRAEALADRLQLDLDRPVHTLSKGNKQKLGLLQAFLHDPELLILDEPTSGLDPILQQVFLGLLREARSAGRTILLSSHVLSEIQHVADDVAILREGRIVRFESVQSLRQGAARRIRVRTPDPVVELMRTLRANGAVGDWEHEVRHGQTTELRGRWRGDINVLLAALATITVHDLAIEEPDLEDAVLQLYTETGAADAR